MKRVWRAAAAMTMGIVAGAGILVAGVASPAEAATGDGCYAYQFVSDNMRMTIENNSSADGARVIQMPAQEGPAFSWCRVTVGTNEVVLWNELTQKCLTTDGVPGHWLFQEPCDLRGGEIWQPWSANYNGYTVYSMSNPASGLSIDVYQDSHQAGTVIDGWKGRSGQGPLNQVMYQLS